MTEQEERFWYGGTKAEIEAAYQKARKQLLDGLYKADDKLAYLRNEAEKYNPYMAYGSDGYIYNPNNIQEQLGYLKSEIEQTILILKESN